MGASADRLPPWKEITYFLSPQVTFLPNTVAAWQPAVSANPNRVGLYLCTSGPSGNTANFSPDPTIVPAGGFFIDEQRSFVHFTEARDGILCTAQWYYNSTGGATAIEVILREWPQ